MKLQELLKKYLTEDQLKEVEPLLEVEGNKIPKERFDEVNTKYKELKELNSTLETELNTIKSNDDVLFLEFILVFNNSLSKEPVLVILRICFNFVVSVKTPLLYISFNLVSSKWNKNLLYRCVSDWPP